MAPRIDVDDHVPVTVGRPDSDTGPIVARLIELGLDRAAAELGAAGTAPIVGPDPSSPGGLMHALDQIDLLGPVLAGVVGAITPDQLDNTTPCAGFSVRGVLDHMVGGASAFAAAFRGQAPPADTAPADDILAAFAPALGDLVAAMHEPGALERTVQAPFGAVDGDTFARFVALDGLVHGWDLAIATGQTYTPPDALVAEVTAFAQGAIDPLRDGDTFAAATEAPERANAMERLAAFTGRRVPQDA